MNRISGIHFPILAAGLPERVAVAPVHQYTKGQRKEHGCVSVRRSLTLPFNPKWKESLNYFPSEKKVFI